MKAIVNRPKMTPELQKLIRHQVSLECQTITRKYETIQDICFIYAVVDMCGWGKKRCEKLYKRFWECRDEVQKFVRAEGENMDLEDGLRETMMERVLLTHGIDVRTWNEEYGKARLEYEIKG